MKTKNIKSSKNEIFEKRIYTKLRNGKSYNSYFVFFVPFRFSLILVFFVLFRFSLISQTPGEWTWMHGNNTPNASGVFGMQGVSDPANTPPAMYEPCEWRDNNGNFWLYGGLSATSGENSALWKYDPFANKWTWMKGPSATMQHGVYGTQGVPSPANYPGARSWGAATWVDASGNLWLFGGRGYAAIGGNGLLNDLWKYNIIANEWTWMKGPNTTGNLGFYGTKGVPNPTNLPRSREETSASWTDNSGNLWLYGGVADAVLWKYDISTNAWTWIHGANTLSAPAVYGTQGVADPANTPGWRVVYCFWVDLTGNLWLFGGGITAGNKNDLWKYDIAANQWTWMKGPSTNNNTGNYGTKCVPANSNVPPARFENRARARDACGNFWNFGGGNSNGAGLNDLWHYNVSANQWTWVSGDNIPGQIAVYGIQGVSSPANKPGGKLGNVAWIDTNGYIWFFGGNGTGGFSNDLFRYVPDTICASASTVITVSSNTTICIGQSATLTATGGTSYSWSPGGQTTSGIVVNPTISATYTVMGAGSCGSTNAAITITVIPNIIAIAGPNRTICNGQNTTLTASGGNSYSWSMGQISSDIIISPSVTTTYSVLISNGTCFDTAFATVIVNPNPSAIATNNTTITQGQSATLTASGGSTYTWSNGANGSSITVTPLITTVYCVTVTDANNCTDTACVTVTIQPIDCSTAGELFLPNAFSPNNDGENDVLNIYYGDIKCIKSFKLVIYNRWGEKVYKSTDPKEGWDGTYKGGKVNTAVFVCYLKATLISGEEIIKKGNISLVR